MSGVHGDGAGCGRQFRRTGITDRGNKDIELQDINISGILYQEHQPFSIYPYYISIRCHSAGGGMKEHM